MNNLHTSKKKTIEEMINELKDYIGALSILYFPNEGVWQVQDANDVKDLDNFFNGGCVQSGTLRGAIEKAYSCLLNQKEFDEEDRVNEKAR